MVQLTGIICKNCGKENFCGCSACKRINKDKLHWSWYKDTIEICGNCKAQLPYENEVE